MFTHNYSLISGLDMAGYYGTNDSYKLALSVYNHNTTINSGYMTGSFGNFKTLMTSCLTSSKATFNSYASTSNSSYFNGVAFGDGTATPSVYDCALSGNHLTSAKFTTAFSFAQDADKTTFSCLYTITNSGAESFTISEVGMFAPMLARTSVIPNSNYAYPVMLERSLLDTPVTIPAGGIGQVTYTIHMAHHA